MDIYDAAGIGRSVSGLLEESLVARQLAELWDNHRPAPTIKERCTTLEKDWNRMVWIKRAHSVCSDASGLLLLAATASLLLAALSFLAFGLNKWIFFGIGLCLLCLLAIVASIRISAKLQARLERYCVPAHALRVLNCEFRVFLEEYAFFKIKCVEDARAALARMCFEIVRIEALGLGEDAEFPDPFPQGEWVQRITIRDLRQRLKRMVKRAETLNVTTGDLTVHFTAAKAQWFEQYANGTVSADFQI